MNRGRAMAVATVLLLCHGRLPGQESEFRFPTDPIAPQTVALGGAGVAASSDAEAALNPAALLNAPRVGIHRFDGYAGYNGFGVAGHLGLGSRLAVGLIFRHFDYGNLVEDELASGVGDLDAREETYAIGAAAQVSPGIRVGATLSHLSADYFGSVTSADVISLGTIVSYSSRGSVGLAVRTLGGDARNNDDPTARYPVPSRVRAGISQGFELGGHDLKLLADGQVNLRGRALPELHVGAEWRPLSRLALRAGAESVVNPDVSDSRDTRFSAGLGIQIGPADLALSSRFGGIEGANELFIGIDAF
jgi:hypothetical protein